jgi:hypothetical protein
LAKINHFSLNQSSKLFGFLLTFYLIVLLLIITYFSSWVQLGLILLTFLQLYADFDQYKSLTNTALTLNMRTNEIQIEIEGISKTFEHFKLYSNRWFLILQLRQKDNSVNLMLLSDRFDSMTEYLLFRHQINKMNQNSNVD